VIDPAPSVTKQVKRLLEAGGMKSQSQSVGSVKLFTSGEPEALKSQLPVLLGEVDVAKWDVERVEWINDLSVIASP
jgi:glutamate racemase